MASVPLVARFRRRRGKRLRRRLFPYRDLNYQPDHLEARQFGVHDKSCKTLNLKNPERRRPLNAREEKDCRIQWLRTRSPRSGTRPGATIHASRRILTMIA